MTVSVKAPTSTTGSIQLNGSDVLTIESDRSVDIDSGTLYVDATNNRVGIGTSSPAHPLQISHATTSRINFSETTNSLTLNIGQWGSKNRIEGSGGSDLIISNYDASNPIAFYTGSGGGNTERMRINASGNVGIGTSSPGTKFHVSDTSTNTVKSRTQASTGYVDIGMGGNSGVFDTSASDGIRLRLSGNDAVAIDASSNFKFNSGYGSVANAYACRAWVNFNGTGTVAIRDSGNVSSITDSGVGDYRVNFSTAMPDTNYAVVGSCQGASGTDIVDFGSFGYSASPSVTPTTSQVAVGAFAYSGAGVDTAYVSVAVFR